MFRWVARLFRSVPLLRGRNGRWGRRSLSGWEDVLASHELTSTIPGILSRRVRVLVPPGYSEAANARRRYPALYMQDGNNCLDHSPFNKHRGWEIDAVSYALVKSGRMKPAILVLVENTANRAEEYVPGAGAPPGPNAEGYLDYLEKAVAPFIDSRYRTLPGAVNRGVGGSSYGGLLSLYAGWTRPHLFGFVMAMSTAFAYDFHSLVRATPPPRRPLRIYIDSGTMATGGSDDGWAATLALRDLLVERGYRLGEDLKHHVGEGDGHREEYWSKRLPAALAFLLPPNA